MTNYTQGQTVEPFEIHRLPIGTQIVHKRSTYTVALDGLWRGREVHPLHTVDTAATIEAVGARQPDLSLAMFKQRLRTLALGQAYRASINREPVGAAFAALDIPAPTRRVGMFVHILDREALDLMVHGTIGVNGDVSDWSRSAVYIYQHNEWRSFFGERYADNACLQIVSFPPGTVVTDWPAREYDEAAAIGAFIRKVCEVGYAAKAASGWCPEFEYAIGRAGVTDAIVSQLPEPPASGGFSEYSPANIEGLEAAGIGTRIRHSGNLWVKALDSTWVNLSPAHIGYVPIGEGTQSQYFGDMATILWRPVVMTPGSRVARLEEMTAARLGSRVTNAGDLWEKVEPNTWARLSRTGDRRIGHPIETRHFSPGSHLLWAEPVPPVFDGRVGEPVASLVQMVAAPAGSVIEVNGRSWGKTNHGLWSRVGRYAVENWIDLRGDYHPHGVSIIGALWSVIPDGSAPVEVSVSPPAVGAPATRAQMADALTGYVVQTRPGIMWRKEGAVWRGNNSNMTSDLNATYQSTMTWVSVTPFSGVVGEELSTAMLERAPVGVQVRCESDLYHKTAWDVWTNSATERVFASTEFRGAVTLVSLP